MKVCFETFGCRLNKAEALQMEADYLAKGWELTEKHADADLIVVRGCSVTARAQNDCETLIAHLKRKYPTTRLLICGCISPAGAPTRQVAPPSTTSHQPPTTTHQPLTTNHQPVPTRTARAYLKVQDGCNGKCTFCIVPHFRGKSVSVDFTEVLDKVNRFIDAGYHEIVVTGCNLALYCSQGKRLPELLDALAKLSAPADCRIRLGSLEPGGCALETIAVLAENDNICRFLHLAIQSGSRIILKNMRRPYTSKDVEDVLSEAERRLPHLGLGCDLMTGFPGETETDFLVTKGLLSRHPFTNAHVFPYSERPNTPAESFSNPVPKEIRSFRAQYLANISQQNRITFARHFIGRTVDVVVEKSEKELAGWTGEYLRCHFTGKAPRKSLVRVFVTKAEKDLLRGRLVT